MKIAIGADHAGYGLKEHLVRFLSEEGHAVQDLGTHSEASVDYPDFAAAVATAVADGEAQQGVAVCGAGLGMAMAANKVDGIRAACCSDLYSARMARAHNNANVLALGGRVIGVGVAEEIVRVFIATEWEAGRHCPRVEKIQALE